MMPTMHGLIAVMFSLPLQHPTTVADLLPLISASVDFAERDARGHAHDGARGPLFLDIQSVQYALAFPMQKLLPDSIIRRVIERPFRAGTRDRVVIEERASIYRVAEEGVLIEVNAVVISPIGGLAYVYITSITGCGGGICPRQWRLTFRIGGPGKWLLVKQENVFVS